MKVVIINPTYNEKGNIEKLITILEEEIFPNIKKYEMYILVADDNSPDGTADVVKNLMKKYKNLNLSQGKKQGLGAAYVRAMGYAIEKLDADIMFEMDADFFHDPKKIPEFLKKIDEGYDMVIGTRYSDGGSIPSNWGLHRKAFSITANFVIRTILMKFSIHDWTGGYRAIRKEVFLKEGGELIKYKGYTFQVAFLYKVIQDGFKVGEVPFHATDRILGRSKIAPLEYIVNLLTYVLTARVKEIILGKFGKFLVVGGLGFVIDFTIYYLLTEKIVIVPGVASIISALFAIFSNYNLNNIWTFKESKVTTIKDYFLKMIQFYASSAFGVVVLRSGAIFILDALFGRGFHLYYYLFGTGLLLIWNFTMYSLVIWRKKPHK